MNSLIVKNITKRYPALTALDNVSLHVSEGETVGILGRKKSGKRTLINTILGRTKHDEGFISIEDIDLTNLSSLQRQSLGLITIDHEFNRFQKIYRKIYPEKSIKEYLLKIIPDYNELLDRKMNKLEKLEIIKSTLNYFGSDVFIDRGFNEQSGGQSLRVKLASCFMRQPKVVILDDPFWGLDNINRRYALKSIRSYCKKNKIGFLFSEDTEDINNFECDRAYLLDSGRIIDERSSEPDMVDQALGKQKEKPIELDSSTIYIENKSNQERFEVFICFKNTDESGRLTRDSELAEIIYTYLSKKGIPAFYSNISLENLGIAAYQSAIDNVLDRVNVLIAVGTSFENLDSEWVRYEWGSFYNDILSGRKKNGRLFVYTENLNVNELPRTLRQNQIIEHQDGSLESIYNFVFNSLNNGLSINKKE